MPKQVLGIELGTEHVAVVQVIGTSKAYDVTTAVSRAVSPSSDSDDPFRPHQAVLEILLDTHRLRGDSIVVSLPAAQTVMRNLTLPFRDPRRIRQVIKYTMDDHMPFDPDEVVADFQVLPGATSSQTPVIAAAVPQVLIVDTLAIFHEIGLEPTIIDVDVSGLSNAAQLGLSSLPERTLLVDIHPERALLTLHDQGKPFFARSWPNGWPQGAGTIETYAVRMSKQIQRTVYAYENALQHSFDAESLVVSGVPEEDYSALAAVLQQSLGIPIEPWAHTAEAFRGNAIAEGNRQTVVALGLALRGLHRQTEGFNLRREQFALHQDLQEIRGRLVVVGCMLVLLAAMGIGRLYLDTHFKAQRLQQLKTDIAQIFQAALPNERSVQPVFQMQEKVEELRNRLRNFGGLTGTQLSGLEALREISEKVPPGNELTLNVDSLTITANTVDISGVTGSIEDVVKLRDALETSTAIDEAKIIRNKKEADKVAFKLTITIAKSQDPIT
ncbi:pilus assembly protein PilM [Candidatus Entotheonella palauensis]|uniref:pilus assembly protein PilM n=1 Tax=Candidatus Entotheonella palauensis TaxID=93172 RepID=UPI000B7F65A1|nr:pilus assembly protein PilM [Candidatus Entotheonella palauensis]